MSFCFFFSSRRRHTRWTGDWSSDVCSSDLGPGRARSVAQAHGQIAQPPLVADAANRRAAHALVEFGLAPGEQLDQGGPVEPVPHRKILFPGNPREPVPWADRLAIV